MIKIDFDIPEKVSTNKFYAGTHWRVRKSIVDTWHEYVSLIALEGNFEPIKAYPVTVSYVFTFKTRALDTLNCAAMAKMAEDAIVRVGILEDDSPKFVNESCILVEKGKRDKLEIIIT